MELWTVEITTGIKGFEDHAKRVFATACRHKRRQAAWRCDRTAETDGSSAAATAFVEDPQTVFSPTR